MKEKIKVLFYMSLIFFGLVVIQTVIMVGIFTDYQFMKRSLDEVKMRLVSLESNNSTGAEEIVHPFASIHQHSE